MKKITDADKARLKKLQAGKGALANGKLSMDEQLEFNALKRKERQATAYSPAPMSAAAKAKAGARGKATAAKTTARGPKAGTTTVAAVARRFGVTVREARDIAKALKNVAESGKSALNLDRTGNQYLGRQAVRETGKDLAKQVRETVRAAKSGQSGSRAGRISYNADTGTPQGLEAPRRPKYGYSNKGPYKTGKKK